MLDVVRKAEYFDLLSAGHADPKDHTLKGIQDGWTLAQLDGVTGKRILEVGGGNSRVLPKLTGNSLWNAEKFQGVGNGPTDANAIKGVAVVPTFMGEFSPDLPEVDIVFSISVIEHIPFEKYHDAFKDMARILSPNGIMYHTIDLPLGDEVINVAEQRIRLLISAAAEAGLKWRAAPAVSPQCVFTSDMASNSDLTMWMWSRISEASKASGPFVQIVTLKMIVEK